MRKALVLLTLFTISSLSAQSWELAEDLHGFITDIEIINGERYTTFKTGELLVGDSIIHTYEAQPGQETGLLSVLFWNGQICINISSMDSVQRIICGQDTIISVPYKNPWSPRHRGGGLVYSGGILYAGFGYGANAYDSQDSMDYRGKIVAITDSTVSIYASGLRNPWKIDARGDTLYISDVGDHQEEEISRIDTAGLNLGWPCFEGNIQHDTTCGSTWGPLFTYPRAKSGNAIIGGKYFQDAYWWCDNYYRFGGKVYDDSTVVKIPCPQYPDGMYVHNGEIFVYDYTGKIYRWVEAPLSIDSVPPDPEKRLLPIIVSTEKIQWNEGLNGTMMILTLNGQIVRYEEAQLPGEIDISDLVSRMYIAVLITPLGVEWRRKLVVW